jgi:D-glycerate 3-kinase
VIDAGLDRHFLHPLLGELTGLAELARSGGLRQVIALNGPVGAGKSTLAALLLERARGAGVRLAVASIDDFYLPWESRAQALAGNPFGVSRVPPGSHDINLALATLAAWQEGEPLRLPRFDKSLRDGQGDRAGERIEAAADVLLLEGWLLGCRPVGQEQLTLLLQATLKTSAQANGSPAAWLADLRPQERSWLMHWDRALEAYQPLWQACTQLWLLRPCSWKQPRRWRFQAEARQRRRGEAWLSAIELDRLVRSSLCSLPPAVYQDPLVNEARGLAILDGRRRWAGGAVAGAGR